MICQTNPAKRATGHRSNDRPAQFHFIRSIESRFYDSRVAFLSFCSNAFFIWI